MVRSDRPHQWAVGRRVVEGRGGEGVCGEERKGDDLLDKMRVATSGGGGGMMRNVSVFDYS